MRRSTSVLLSLFVALLGGLLAVPEVAHADGGAPNNKTATTVGIRTSGRTAPDNRGNYAYDLSPGGYRVDYVAISNFSYHAVTVRLLAADATTTPGVGFGAVGGTPVDAGSWVTYQQATSITIPARAQHVAAFQVSVPRDATPGDHSAAILVSLLGKELKPNGGQIVVDRRVGLRMRIRVPGQLKGHLKIENLHTRMEGGWHFWAAGRLMVDYTVVNDGNVAVCATAAVRFGRTLQGSVRAPDASIGADSSGKCQSPILPRGSLNMHQESTGRFAPGWVDAHVTVTPTAPSPGIPVAAASASQTIFVWPWGEILTLLGLILAAWYWRHRRRVRAKRLAAARRRRDVPTGGTRAREKGVPAMRTRLASARWWPFSKSGAAPTAPEPASPDDATAPEPKDVE